MVVSILSRDIISSGDLGSWENVPDTLPVPFSTSIASAICASLDALKKNLFF